MSKELTFSDRQEFRDWLNKNGTESEGVWLIFGKKGGPKTLTAGEALEEALCYGWIDGVMKSLDNTKYKKYFAKRINKSNWSDKNKKIAQTLIEKGMMTKQGMKAIERAKSDGFWTKSKSLLISDNHTEEFERLVSKHEPAYTNLLAMSPSVRRTYTGFYFDAKTDTTRRSRLEKIIERLNRNLKPM